MSTAIAGRLRALRLGQRWWRGLPLVLAALCVAAALVKLWPPGPRLDTVAVPGKPSVAADSPGQRFDALLLQNLPHLRHIRYFDEALGAGAGQFALHQPLWVDRCEVTQGDFQRFAAWQLLRPQEVPPAPGQPQDWRHRSNTRGHALSGRLDAAANGVGWFDAVVYCRAAGGRLPAAQEWVAAAAGLAGRLYPWGDTFREDGWPHVDPRLNAALACATTPGANTPEGIAGLGHGVSEWAVAGNGGPVAMGGNAIDAPADLHSLAALYRRLPPNARSPYLGFRCVHDQPPAVTPWHSVPDAVAIPPGEYPVGMPPAARVPKLLALLPPSRRSLIGELFAAEPAGGARNSDGLALTVREVTRGEYAAFLRDPFVAAGFHAETNQPQGHSHRPPDWAQQAMQPQLPVVNVDWWSAYAFAAWAGGRLPDAEEWERAASGQGERMYPWGDSFAAASPITGERALGGPGVSTAADGDATAEGLLALGGNVSEWTRSVSAAGGTYAVVVKGGNYLLPGRDTARWDYRSHVSPNYRAPTLGFRVAFDGR